MLHEELTGKIFSASFDVMKEIGAGFLESVYEKALAIALCERGLTIKVQHPISVCFRGKSVGEFWSDILVLLELKAVKALLQAQTINYLKATGIPVGLLINFGNPRLEYRRLSREKSSAELEATADQPSTL